MGLHKLTQALLLVLAPLCVQAADSAKPVVNLYIWGEYLAPDTLKNFEAITIYDGKRYGVPGKPFESNRWLVDGDTVTVGDVTLNVRHCPGHTPGHVVFHHPESKLAIVGDVLFQGSIGRTDFPRGNHQDLLDSITQRLWPMGGDTAFVPGHGPVSTFAHERASNPFVGDAVVA